MKKINISTNIICVLFFLLLFLTSCKKNITNKKSVSLDICMKKGLSGSKRKMNNFMINNKKNDHYEYIKQSRKNMTIDASTSDFKDLILKSDFYIDKSCFIKEVFSNSSVQLITMPRRWGKSINLDMLRRFLTNVDDDGRVIEYSGRSQTDNYKLFAGGTFEVIKQFDRIEKNIPQSALIIEKPQAINYLSYYPVIYIDFKTCTGSSIKTISQKLKTVFSKCFKQHDYLRESKELSSKDKNIFEQYCNETVDTESGLEYGLYFLSECLKEHHKKKVWILIDEYDAPLNSLYFNKNIDNSEVSEGKELFRNLYANTFKNNKNLEKGVLTGILNIAQSDLGSGFNNAEKFNVQDAKYAQYYGLDENEIDDCLEQYELSKKKEGINHWYNGYKLIQNNGSSQILLSRYNIYSIVKYLNSTKTNNPFQSYWTHSGAANFFTTIFKKPRVKEKIEQLLSSEHLGKEASIKFSLRQEFTKSDFDELKKISDLFSNNQITDGGLDLLFSYLFYNGYLTITENKDYYSFPNEEIRYEMKKKIIEHYKIIYRISTEDIKELIDLVQNFIDKEINLEQFKNVFKNLFEKILKSCSFEDSKQGAIFANEDFVHSLLNYICMQVVYTNFATEKYTTKLSINSPKKKKDGTYIKDARADILLKNKDNTRGMIIEIKYQGKAEEALDQAKYYGRLLKDCQEKIYIGLNVAEDKTVTLKYEANGIKK